ncbi:DUF1842 domain-containing protein [Vibrio jasicida]|uniref:DUF1842 domain-containing protein n=1 Tax=Vibrio jasicida TaxID=766224 RepID=UPI0005F06E4C|nr:DUF1842 domain-containing protein [Vibrio jasicida]PQJ49133.1 hypothetical protein BTO01_27030 [Vibrio jasicida]CAH1608328.1 conserved hypothetical protein [Vibrio jasicida]
MKNQTNQSHDVFLASYIIGNKLAGGIRFDVKLLVGGPGQSITGKGNITQAVSPPLHVHTELTGNYHYQATMRDCHIMINLQGYQAYPGIPPVGADLHNVTLRILLNDDWKSGVAFYSYKDSDGNWVDVENQPVTLESNDQVENLEKLTATHKELSEA